MHNSFLKYAFERVQQIVYWSKLNPKRVICENLCYKEREKGAFRILNRRFHMKHNLNSVASNLIKQDLQMQMYLWLLIGLDVLRMLYVWGWKLFLWDPFEHLLLKIWLLKYLNKMLQQYSRIVRFGVKLPQKCCIFFILLNTASGKLLRLINDI